MVQAKGQSFSQNNKWKDFKTVSKNKFSDFYQEHKLKTYTLVDYSNAISFPITAAVLKKIH